jgi:DNA-binding CsgD family transcriptional regulator
MGVLLASVIVVVLGSQMQELMLEGTRARAVDQLELGILDQLRDDDFAPPFTADGIDDLSARIAPVVARVLNQGSGVVRINVVGVDGTILFSDNPSIRGKTVPPAEKPELATALSGAIGSTGHSGLSSAENEDLRPQFEDVIEVYVPIVLDGRLVGAYEIYQDSYVIRPALAWVWATIVLASIILSALLARWALAAEPPRVADHARGTARHDISAPAVVVGSSDVRASLTPRELQVLRLMATSHGYRDIAAELVVSEETVRTHVKSILRKLHQPDRTRAVLAAVAEGILEVPAPGSRIDPGSRRSGRDHSGSADS